MAAMATGMAPGVTGCGGSGVGSFSVPGMATGGCVLAGGSTLDLGGMFVAGGLLLPAPNDPPLSPPLLAGALEAGMFDPVAPLAPGSPGGICCPVFTQPLLLQAHKASDTPRTGKVRKPGTTDVHRDMKHLPSGRPVGAARPSAGVVPARVGNVSGRSGARCARFAEGACWPLPPAPPRASRKASRRGRAAPPD